MNEFEKRLVEALRSGTFKQGTGSLRRGPNFCCLGVACHLYNPFKWHGRSYNYSGVIIDEYTYLLKDLVLPEVVRQELRWSSSNGSLPFLDRSSKPLYLTTLNDNGFTFDQIADVIEAGLVVKENESI